MLTDKLPPEEIEVPNEPGNFFTFRILSAEEIDEARAASVKETVTRFGPETMKMLAGMESPAGQRQQRNADPTAGYSHGALIKFGLVSWRGANYDAPCVDERKEKLTAKTRAWAAAQIARISEISEGEAGSSGAGIAENETSPAPLSPVSNES